MDYFTKTKNYNTKVVLKIMENKNDFYLTSYSTERAVTHEMCYRSFCTVRESGTHEMCN